MGCNRPSRMGLVKSLARPDTNVTGLTSEAGAEIYGKRLELFKEAIRASDKWPYSTMPRARIQITEGGWPGARKRPKVRAGA